MDYLKTPIKINIYDLYGRITDVYIFASASKGGGKANKKHNTEREKVVDIDPDFDFGVVGNTLDVESDDIDIQQLERETPDIVPHDADPLKYSHITRSSEKGADQVKKDTDSVTKKSTDPGVSTSTDADADALEFAIDDILSEPDKKVKVTSQKHVESDQKDPSLETELSDIPKVEKIKPKIKPKIHYTNLTIYPNDNIIQMKQKIQFFTGIPLYRQHIWYKKNKLTTTLSYHVHSENSEIDINIEEFMSYEGENIEGIPIIQNLYDRKNTIKVIAEDQFTLVQDYYFADSIFEFNLIDMDQFMPPKDIRVGFDKYKIDLIYYGFVVLFWPIFTSTVFSDYVKNEKNLPDYYPQIYPDNKQLSIKFEEEAKIYKSQRAIFNNKKELNKIQGKLESSITYSVLNVITEIEVDMYVVSLRNLFDLFRLSDKIPWCKVILDKGAREVYVLSKTYKDSKGIYEISTQPSITFKIVPHEKSVQFLNLTIFTNGNYLVKSHWHEEKGYGFDEIQKLVNTLVNPIIKTINSLGSKVFVTGKKLQLMSKDNTTFTKIDMSLYYKRSITGAAFQIFVEELRRLQTADMVTEKLSEGNVISYYFKHGMSKYNSIKIEHSIPDISNYYAYLSDSFVKQKWETLFDKTRITKFIHRFSDIKIDITGIQRDEFNNFYSLIVTLLYNIENFKGSYKAAEGPVRKKLRNLKTQDPLLYDFKNIYNSDVIYSKKCQKPYQPIIITKDDADKVPAKDKKSVTKYWNFTTKEPAYYKCPDPRYPYIKFIIGEHPKGYCIPCCKKTRVEEDASSAKTLIHNTCLTDHVYEEEKRTITVGSRYIMSYGKDVEVGRVSKLPEDSMEPIFHENYSEDGKGKDQECAVADNYLLYGVEQNTPNINKVGYLYCVASAINKPPEHVIDILLKELNTKPNTFRLLLNGSIEYYFLDVKHFTTIALDIFGKKALDFFPLWYNKVPWNDILIDLVRRFMKITTIKFKEEPKTKRIIMKLPKKFTLESYIHKDYQNIIVLDKGGKYFPVYLMNTDVFFKTKIIDTKLFHSSSNIITNITMILKKRLKLTTSGNAIRERLNLIGLREYLKHSKYKINTLYVNKSDYCYAVSLVHKPQSQARSRPQSQSQATEKGIYLPIDASNYIMSQLDDEKIVMMPIERKKNCASIKELNDFLKGFNLYADANIKKIGAIDETDEGPGHTIFAPIKVEKWIVVNSYSPQGNTSNSSTTHTSKTHASTTAPVIGFIYKNMNFYFHPSISQKQANDIKPAKIHTMLYDPDIVNKKLYQISYMATELKVAETKTNSTNVQSLAYMKYQHLSYKLFLLEVMNYIRNHKNTAIRTKIEQALKNPSEEKKYTLIEKVFQRPENNVYTVDMEKIKKQIKMHNKQNMITYFKEDLYQFDMDKFYKLASSDKKEIISYLKSITSQFISVVPEAVLQKSIKDISNIYGACGAAPTNIKSSDKNGSSSSSSNKDNDICSGKKLKLTKQTLEDYIDMLAADILNPMKNKWIFNPIMTDPVLHKLRFIRRENEKIFIKIVPK